MKTEMFLYSRFIRCKGKFQAFDWGLQLMKIKMYYLNIWEYLISSKSKLLVIQYCKCVVVKELQLVNFVTFD